VKKEYRPWSPDQSFLLPPSPTEWLPKGHLAYFVLDLVSELDLRAIEDVIHGRDPRGTRPYSPRMMTSLIIYAYCAGVFSSRRIETATYEDVAFRMIAGGSHPFFTTVNEFRLEHRRALSSLFLQVLKLCGRAGLKTVGHVSLDGSKVQANASKHKAMSYGRMKEEEKRLEAEIEALMRRAEETDAQEDAEHGPGKRGDEVDAELQFREGRLRRIREAKAALEREAKEARAAELREQAAGERATSESTGDIVVRRRTKTRAAIADKKADDLAPRNDDDDHDGKGGQLPLHRVSTTTNGEPGDKAQRNFTDPDSRIMPRNGVFMQAYNAQAVVSEDQIIVAHGITNDPTDARHLPPMMERVRVNCGRAPDVLTADSGYSSERNGSFCEANGIDAFIAVQKMVIDDRVFPPTSTAQHSRFAMRLKLASATGKALYAKRKVIVEPVFGQIKQAMGFRRFSLRGLEKVSDEWGIVSLCHNVLKLFRRIGPEASVQELPV
jgi:transposase